MMESAPAAARRWRAQVASEDPSRSDEPLRVVFVCTGNRFRSPLAAALFAEAARRRAVVESAGTIDLHGTPPFPETIDEATRLGVDVATHRSRWVGDVDLRSADLVVGFEQSHVATAVVDGGARRDRAFTLPELVGLLGTADHSPREAIARAGSSRGNAAHPPEIEDAAGRGRKAFHEIAGQIDELVTELATRLFR